MRRNKLLMIAAPLALMVLASCGWGLRGFKFTKTSVTEGGQTTIRIFMGPETTSSFSSYVWFLVGVPNSNKLSVGQTKWDVRKEFNGVKIMVNHTALLNTVLNSNACDDFGFDQQSVTNVTWKLVRTPGVVNNKGQTGKKALSLLRLNVASDADASAHRVFLFTGNWADDGDNTPENSEITCTGIGGGRIFSKNA